MNKEQLKQRMYENMRKHVHKDSHGREVLPLWRAEALVDFLIDEMIQING